ncbi:CDP-glycerol glycerophosphotransferase family protein [Psychrobacter sp. AOP7-D2-23]|uniref:CDP-glycerol glycerophosphotransferase family protein n=1 Tax=unclassified Psychrobacter TaxID=196806 RepID=UPI00186A7F92|nr:CDP-glycerol glycerophosphotransferase family protein [Psychrobacter sp. FME60]
MKLLIPKKLRGREKKSQLIAKYDRIFPKISKKVILVVKKNTEYSGNLRICADLFLRKGKHKLYVYKDDTMPKSIEKALTLQGVTVLKPNLWLTFYHILTAGVFVFSHVPRDAHLSLKNKKRKVLGLWHGVAFKNIESQMISVSDSKMELIKNNAKLYDLMIASSEADKKYIAKSFLVDESIIDITGLPRYELLKSSYQVDEFLQLQKNKLDGIKLNKKFILYAPTFREKNESAFDQICDEEWIRLNQFLENSDVILGLRPHSYDNKKPPTITEKMSHIVWLSQEEFTESNLILQFVSFLVVDFSSIWIDYLLLDRPILGFAKDFEHYCNNERGFAYDFEETFPDNFAHNFDDFITNLMKLIKSDINEKSYKFAKEKFHKHSLKTSFSDNLASSLKKLEVI